jgi:hypothetical protein
MTGARGMYRQQTIMRFKRQLRNWTKSEGKKIDEGKAGSKSQQLYIENRVFLLVNTIACKKNHMQLPISVL